MFKKTLALLAATVTLAVGMGTVALAANCADGAHRPAKSSEKAATCTTDGSITYVCGNNGCNASWTDVIPAKGHSTVLVDKTESTCKDPGIATYECKVCFTTTTEKLPLAAHTWVESDAKAPTCTEEGVTAGKVCKVCGYTEKTPTTTPAAGHTWGEWKVLVASTCTMNGYEQHTCTVCGLTVGRDIVTSGHNYVVVPGKAATCLEPGQTDATVCSVCGDEKIAATMIPALGHDWVDTTIITAQTCSTNGVAVHTCERCGQTERRTLWADGKSHNIVTMTDKAATCKEAGLIEKNCNICWNAYTAKVIDQLECQYQPVVVQKQTCTQDGLTVYECMYCGERQKKNGQDVILTTPMIKHKYAVEQKAVEPTCTTDGTSRYWYCPDCKMYAYEGGNGFTATVPPVRKATGHAKTNTQYTAGKYDIVKATCVSPEKIVYHCVNSDACTYTWVVVDEAGGPAPTAHKFVNVPAQDATCTEKGWKAYDQCSLCGIVGTVNNKVPYTKELGHDWTVVAGKAATCTEAGYSEAHKCTRCPMTVGGQTVPALGHKYVWNEKLGVDVCSVCNDIKYPEETGCKHQWIVLKGTPATCTSAGVSDGKKCTVCGEVQGYEKLPRLEHKAYYVPAVAPTCTKDGHSALYACEYCYKALTEYDVYMSNGEHTPVYGYDNDVHYMACKTCGEILLSGDHELVTTVSGGKVHTACKWCAYSKVSSIFGN